MTGQRRFVVLANRHAGAGGAPRRLAAVLRSSPEFARRAEVVRYADGTDLEARLRGLELGEIPVAAGGDGTLNHVIACLRALGAGHHPVGVLPLGTGNAIAHAIGVPTPARAVLALLHGAPRACDLLVTDRREMPVALGSISAGVEAAFLAIAGRRRTWRRWPRAVAAIPGIVAHARTPLRIGTDEGLLPECAEPLANVGIYNTPCYAFGIRPWPDARLDDGVAEVVTWRGARDWLGLALSAGRWHPAGVHVRRGTCVRIETEGALQVDGESIPGPEISARLVVGGCVLITP